MKRVIRLVSLMICMMLVLAMVPAFAGSTPYRIDVDCTNNIVTVYSTLDDSIVRQMVCSSGVAKWPSPHGHFVMPESHRTLERKEWYAFEDGYGKYGSRIRGNYLFHSYLFLEMDDSKVDWETYVAMGCKASHGCIRLWIDDAKWICENCLSGTKVHVFDNDKKLDYLKELLYEKTFSIDDGLTYEEYTCQASSPDELGYNSKGDDVTELQNRLKELGLYGYEADGYYGPAMVRTVKALQGALGLKQTGVVDLELSELIYSDDAPSSNIVTLKEGVSSSAVTLLQAMLTNLGLYSGELDGEFDEEVTDSVKLFQMLYGVETDGVVTSGLMASMDDALAKLNAKFGEGNFAMEYVEKEYPIATINSSKKLNMRKKGSSKADTVAKIEPGTQVDVIEKGKNWTCVSYDGKKGYVSTDYLKFDTRTETVPTYVQADETHEAISIDTQSDVTIIATQEITFGKISTKKDDRIFVRNAPDSDSKVVFMLPNGTTVKILSVSGSWAYVSYGGRTGFAKSELFEKKKTVEIAPYLLNATGANAEDNKVYALVTDESGASLMSSANDDAEELTYIPQLEKAVVVLEGTNNTMVDHEGTKGYIANDKIFIGTNDEINAQYDAIMAGRTFEAVVSAPGDAGLNMRADASTDSDVVTVLKNGEMVTVIEDMGTWSEVRYNDLTGYVMSEYITALTDGEAYDPVKAGYEAEPEDDWETGWEEDPIDDMEDPIDDTEDDITTDPIEDWEDDDWGEEPVEDEDAEDDFLDFGEE